MLISVVFFGADDFGFDFMEFLFIMQRTNPNSNKAAKTKNMQAMSHKAIKFIPSFIGTRLSTPMKMLIKTRNGVRRSPTLPGYDSGGKRKLKNIIFSSKSRYFHDSDI